MKVVIQHDVRDCGAACLKMILEFYKLKLPFSKCRELVKTDKIGSNIYGLIDGARKTGLEGEALYGDSKELMDSMEKGEVSFPFIAHIISETGLLHFVVVFGYKKRKFIIGDPEKGKVKLNREEFFRRWTGNIVLFKKTPEFRSGNYTKGSINKFFKLLKGQYVKLVTVFIISLFIALIGIMSAFVFQLVIDNFAIEVEESSEEHESCDDENCEECLEETQESETNKDMVEIIEGVLENIANVTMKSRFDVIFVLVIGLYLIQAAIQFARGYLILSVSRKIDIRLILSYYNHIIDLPIASVTSRNTGEYLSRFSETSSIREAISGATVTLMLDSLMVIASGVILFLQNEKLFGISLIMVVLYAVIMFFYRKPVEESTRTVMENDATLQSFLKESIDGIETIKAARAEKNVKEKTESKFKVFIDSVFKANMIAVSQDIIADTVELIGTIIILWMGFMLVIEGKVTIGELMTFYILLSYFSSPIKNLIQLQPEIQTAFVAADRLNDILDLETEQLKDGIQKLENVSCWQFENVDFRYGNRELTLKNINMSIQKGEKIAIVGESGCGKTTIAKLLLRFYEVESGDITIGNFGIEEIDVSALRKSIAYVDQNTFVFSDTVKNNLKLGNPQATDEEICKVCKIAQADEFIETLPMGYETMLDENGMDLSGGQRQRLAIARALLSNPKLLILDEATSNLDTITEAAIKDTVFEFSKDLTCIIIAHRLNTIRDCDRIFVMDKGEIVEEGNHNELMQLNGRYAKLWEQGRE